jgi:hypothetical protein
MHSVDVGAFGKLVFSPSQIDAAIGDVIEFNFLAVNHTLTQSELHDPCNSTGQFDTGFNQFNPRNETGKFIVRFEVKSSAPQWFYCSQTIKSSHCRAGMVFGLNTAGQMNQFIQNATALQTTVNTTPPPTLGLLSVGNIINGINTTHTSHGNTLIAAK